VTEPDRPRRTDDSRRAPAEPDEPPVLPEVSGDERDIGWSEDPGGGRRDEEWYRRERPPHHE
jgi:hypothetical protein